MSTVKRTSGVAGTFPYRLDTVPYSAPVERIYSDVARTVLVHGPVTLAAVSTTRYTGVYPATLAAGTYYLKLSTVFTNGQPAVDDTSDVLVLVAPSGSVADTFATVQDLATWLQRTLADDDAAANLALEVATAAIRREAHQTISLVDDDPVVLTGNWGGSLWLPERPVLDVTAVQVTNGRVDAASWLTAETLAVGSYVWARNGLLQRASGWWGGSEASVLVTYSHGYETIPGDIRGLCLQVAGEVFESTGSLISMDSRDGVDGMRDATTRGMTDVLTTAAKRMLRDYRPRLR